MKHLYLLTLILTFTSCLTVPELLDKGCFGEAYELAYKHCTCGRAPSGKQLDGFIDVYVAIQASDQSHASAFLREPGKKNGPTSMKCTMICTAAYCICSS
ncbi:MAG: hypothetical protein ACI819_000239 [Neolewinella sp.]|jgi:hypothetical protein